MDVMRRRKKTSLFEFFRTRKIYKNISDEEIKDKSESKINSYWKLVILYNSGKISEIKTTEPDSEYVDGEEYFKPFLEWFMCSTNPYYLLKHDVGTRIYIRKEITEINLVKFTTEEEIKK